ncbi:hypothetical protein SK128_005678 [Halocaridina rubra]|uniref:PA domain-containing protein n=1 Tax=Halocaridina rubra TaxID=373956 RepID=A0AAN8XJ51_HALRR
MNDWVYRGAKLGIFTAFLSVIIALWSYSNAKGIDVFSTPLEERESETAPEHSLWKKPTGNNYFGTAGLSLLNKMDPKNIEDYLRYLTSTGHMAGTKQDLEQAEFVKEFFLEHGIDSAHLQPYNVQLSYPDISNPNKVYLIDGNGSVKFTSRILEENQNGVPYDESIPPAFMAFSPAGSITTKELVFVNYGRYEDFQQVKAMGINITGKIVIAKFGRIFRGDKVLNAQRFNATGVILYTDPSDYHPDSDSGGPSYPNSYWLPGSGIQRGSIMWRDGDPTTPFYPSIVAAVTATSAVTTKTKTPKAEN